MSSAPRLVVELGMIQIIVLGQCYAVKMKYKVEELKEPFGFSTHKSILRLAEAAKLNTFWRLTQPYL